MEQIVFGCMNDYEISSTNWSELIKSPKKAETGKPIVLWLSIYIYRGSNGDAWVEANGQQYSPSQIGAFILTKMKENAEAYLGKSINKAVITVPAYFNDAQRQATKDAGRIAEGLVAVFDLGGGTFDVSILEISNGVFEVRATDGDTFLGGEDFDKALLEFLVSLRGLRELTFQKTSLLYKDFESKLRKLRYSFHQHLKLISACSLSQPMHQGLNILITRSKFETLVNHLTEKTMNPCKNCLKDAGIFLKDVDDLLLVGGSSNLSKRRDLKCYFFRMSIEERSVK